MKAVGERFIHTVLSTDKSHFTCTLNNTWGWSSVQRRQRTDSLGTRLAVCTGPAILSSVGRLSGGCYLTFFTKRRVAAPGEVPLAGEGVTSYDVIAWITLVGNPGPSN